MGSNKGSRAGSRSSSYVRVPGGGPSGEPPVQPSAAAAAHSVPAVMERIQDVIADVMREFDTERVWISEVKERLPGVPSAVVDEALLRLANGQHVSLYRADNPLELTRNVAFGSTRNRPMTDRAGAAITLPTGEKRHIVYQTARDPRYARPEAPKAATPKAAAPKPAPKPKATKAAKKATKATTKAAAGRGTADRASRAKEIRAGKSGRTDAVAHLKSVLGRTASLSPGQIDSAVGSLRKLSVADLKYVQKRFMGLNIGGSSKKQMLHWIAKKIHDVQESRERVRGIEKMNM
jgi:hypothetical protein